MLVSIEGVYRNGKIELVEGPGELYEETPVIVTFLFKQYTDLQVRQIGIIEAAELRARPLPFADEWESPEMEIYDDCIPGRTHARQDL